VGKSKIQNGFGRFHPNKTNGFAMVSDGFARRPKPVLSDGFGDRKNGGMKPEQNAEKSSETPANIEKPDKAKPSETVYLELNTTPVGSLLRSQI
jgi:hypothetical protein